MNSVSAVSSQSRLSEYYKFNGANKKEVSPVEQKKYDDKSTVQGKKEISSDEQKKIEELKKRDVEVKVHEQAHVSAGGAYIRGGPHYQYTSGPDGKQYATAGDVNIDTSKVADNPSATIQKAQTVKRAALAPANPSSADRSAAAQAGQMEMEARQELLKNQTQKQQTYTKDGTKVKNKLSPSFIDVQI